MSEETIKIGTVLDIGESQKSIKELRDDIKITKENLEDLNIGTEEYNETLKSLNESQKELDVLMNQAANNTFSSVQNATDGMIGGFQALQGIMALTGGENEKLVSTLVKLQAVSSIASGFKSFTSAIQASSTAMKIFNITILANPIMALVASIIAVVAALAYFADAAAESASGVAELNKEEERYNKTLEANSAEQEYNIRMMKARGAASKDLIKSNIEFTNKEIQLAEIRNDSIYNEIKLLKEKTKWYTFGLGAEDRRLAKLEEMYENSNEGLAKLYEKQKRLNQDMTINSIEEETKQEKDLEESNKRKQKETKDHNDKMVKEAEDYQKRKEKLLEDFNKSEEALINQSNKRNRELEEEQLETNLEKINYFNERKLEAFIEVNKKEREIFEAGEISADDGAEEIEYKIQLNKELLALREKLMAEDDKLFDAENERFKKQKEMEAERQEIKLEYQQALIEIEEYKEEQRLKEDELDLIKLEKEREDKIAAIEDLETKLSMKDLEIEKERELLDEYAKLTQERINIDNKYTQKKKKVEDKKKQIEQAGMKNTAMVLGNIGQMFADHTAAHKALSAASTLIDTYASATSAYRYMAKIGGPVAGAVAAAAAVASGLANVKAIMAADVEGSSSNSGSLPSVQEPQYIEPIEVQEQYVKMDNNDLDVINNTNQKVYVVESDITNTQSRVKVNESEATF